MAVWQHRVVKRFYAEAIARHESRLLLLVPQYEGKHAAETVDALLAPRPPRMNDHFSVAAGAEHVSERAQFSNQLLIVVDLAIKNYDHRAVFVVERLLAGCEIDD